MSFASPFFPVPTVRGALVESAVYLLEAGSGAANPGGSQRAYRSPPTACFVFPLGVDDDGHRYRGFDLQFFSNGADNSALVIPEIGIIDPVRSKKGLLLDLGDYEPLAQGITATFGTSTMSATQTATAELNLSGTIRFADTLSVATKTTMWANLLVEGGKDMVVHSPADNTIARLRFPYTADAAFGYVYAGNVVGVGTGLGILVRQYGGKR